MRRLASRVFQGRTHIERDRLIWIALVALTELVQRSGKGPIEPSHSIRATLATLYAFSDGEREPYGKFWRAMQDRLTSQPNATMADYCRTTYLRISLTAIIRSVGMRDTLALHERLGEAARAHRAGGHSTSAP